MFAALWHAYWQMIWHDLFFPQLANRVLELAHKYNVVQVVCRRGSLILCFRSAACIVYLQVNTHHAYGFRWRKWPT